MKVLLSWLKEFAPIEGDPVALGGEMSDLGMAVESIDHLGQGLDGIVVARVLDLRPHPNADKIQLVDVDAGDGEALQICCGAFNMSVGDLVPLATLGTVMGDGMKIERRKLRGEWSNGMLCSGRELGLGDDHEGILILDPASVPGDDLKRSLGIVDDVLYDLEINPNRPDAMSVAGVARDLAARLGVPFTQLAPTVTPAAATLAGRASVEIAAPELCGRFYGRVLDDITIGPSPRWLSDRLTALGMRPINNVVDASNYVMLELGQPSHTYDLAKLRDGHLRVRWAREGERIVTLDEIERTLTSGDGVLADADDVAVGIAGVMGGASTEISDTTASVLLEMAWWHPMTIARSSKRLNLRSEASARFERGCDPDIVELAALRFAELLAPDGVTLATGAVDVDGDRPARVTVPVRTARVNAVLGTELTATHITRLLRPIGFDVAPSGPDDGSEQLVTVPTFRPDTSTEIDVIEEIARHHGYSNIPRRIPSGVRAGSLTPRQHARRLVRQTMLGVGLDEAMPLAFLAPDDLATSGLPEVGITLTNPLAAEESVLRTSLRPGLLKSVAYNVSHRNESVGLFEIGKVFLPPPPGQQLPDEREVLSAVLAGPDARAAVEVWLVLVDALGIHDASLHQTALAGLHPTRAAEIVVAGEVLGAVGEIDPVVLDRLGIPGRVAWLEVDLDRLLDRPRGTQAYAPVSRYPSSDIDLAFVAPDTVPAGAIRDTIASSAGELLAGVRLFDVFRSDALAPGTRSLAFTLRLQATDRTLTDDDVAAVRTRVIDAVESTHGATLRT
ncbi:MAG: phenylalanine--tRNA ligase subunit beta [Acidimicrobiales bacterium]